MPKRKRSICRLVAVDDAGKQVEAVEMALDVYYEEQHQIIDSAAHRQRLGIARVKGTIFDSSGSQVQEFENTYDASGRLTGSVGKYPDGTIDRWPAA